MTLTNRQKLNLLDAKEACLYRLMRRRSVGRALLYDARGDPVRRGVRPMSGFMEHICGRSGLGFECPACEVVQDRREKEADTPHAFVADPQDATRVRYGQEDIEHCVFCGQAENRPIHRQAVR